MEEMSLKEAKVTLAASRLGYLGLVDGSASYVVPLYFAYGGDAVYFQCHPGRKDAFIAGTGTACLTVVHLESHHIWESVQVFGPLEKLTLTDDIAAAKAALLHVPYPPREGNFPKGMPKRSPANMYYLRLQADRIAGMKSTFKEQVKAVRQARAVH